MKVAIICIGDELLKGSVINTNLAFMGQKLLGNGIIPSLSIEVPDRKNDILDALDLALERADVVLTSGGLGPTADDVTKEYIAERMGAPLVQNGDAAVAILRHWNTLHLGEMPSRIMNQSLVPQGATVIMNRFGTAPGLIMNTKDSDRFPHRTIMMMPGPPSELCPMFAEEVLPALLKYRTEVIHSKLFLVSGIGESVIEERMLPVIQRYHPLSVAYCASPQYVKLFLSSTNPETLGKVIREVRGIFAHELLADQAVSLADEVLELLRQRGELLATAESCTGGLVAKLLTDISGSSDVFKGSVVAYANEVKESMLGVSPDTLKKFGAVSRECALEMVNGAVARFGVHAAVALTGVAGPDGGTPEKPVGLVYLAVRYKDQVTVEELHLRRSREQIRDRAAAKGLNLLRRMMLGLDSTPY